MVKILQNVSDFSLFWKIFRFLFCFLPSRLLLCSTPLMKEVLRGFLKCSIYYSNTKVCIMNVDSLKLLEKGMFLM